MKAEKIIRTTEPIDIEIEGITLLSIEEYKECKDIIPLVDDWWWLRSPGGFSNYAANVDCDGCCDDFYGLSVDRDALAVRPALIYESDNLQIRDNIKLVDYNWTVISDNLMLCNDVIGHTCFRRDGGAKDANDYEKSDIKKWLEKWLEKKQK